MCRGVGPEVRRVVGRDVRVCVEGWDQKVDGLSGGL